MSEDRLAVALSEEERRLREELVNLRDRIAQINHDLARIARVKTLLVEQGDVQQSAPRLSTERQSAPELKIGSNAAPSSAQSRHLPTIKTMVMHVLNDSEAALQADLILERINEEFGAGLVRTSLSPQLSRLRREGKLRYDPSTRSWGNRFHLPNMQD